MSAELGHFAKVQGGFAFKSKDFGSEGIPVIKIANVTGGGFVDLSSYECIQPDLYPKVDQFLTERDDVLIAMTGANVGKVVRISHEQPQCAINQRVGRLQLKAHCEYSKDFFYYLTSSPAGYKHFVGAAYGSAQPNISAALIEKLQIPNIPPAIANQASSFLRQIDDKIQLNHQINQTLEQMAQAIFKSWFVDFEPVKAKIAAKESWQALQAEGEAESLPDLETWMNLAAMQVISGQTEEALNQMADQQPEQFSELFKTAALFPAAMQDSELGEIPEGWDCLALDQIAKYQNGLALQKFRPENEDDYLPVVKIAQLKKGYTDGEEKASPNIKSDCIIDNGDVVFSWSGSLMVDTWCGGKAALNQHLFKVTSINHPKWFYFHFTRHHLAEFQRIAADKAVTMGHIKREHLKSALCAVPNQKLIDKAGRTLGEMLEKQINLRLEAKSLSMLRDTLLPKLLSGELSVADLELEEA